MSEQAPKFIVDSMLGDVAKWLRILGYSATYLRDSTDDQILEIAYRSQSILLTRDRTLYLRALRRGVSCIFIEGTKIEEILAQLAKKLNIRLEIDFTKTRCPLCNQKLIVVTSDKVKCYVPEGVLRLHKRFFMCPRCRKVYWTGSHYKSMVRILEKAKRLKETREG